MAIPDTLDDMNSQFKSDYPTTRQYMTNTYLTDDELGRSYAFGAHHRALGYYALALANGTGAGTYWIDMMQELIERMLSRRDDRSATLSEYDPANGS